MKKLHTFISLLVLTALLPGCSHQAPAQQADISTPVSSAPAALSSAPSPVLSSDGGSLEESSAPAQTDGLEGQIMGQSFQVNLDGWEDVTFASFLPKKEEQGDGDVRFMLLKNGKDIYDFPGLTQDNRCPGEKFEQVSAVAFKDYNGDGKTDIILILKYSSLSHPEQTTQKIRLYTQAGNSKKFIYDQYLAERLTANGYSTVKAVMEDISENSNYQEALNEPKTGTIEKQLKLIADQRDLWAISPDGSMSGYSYAVTDLDQNGHLELIVSTTQGSAHYTDSTYYEVNTSFDGLSPCKQDKKEGDPLGSLGAVAPVYCDLKAGVYHYIVTDRLIAGTSVSETMNSLTLTDGKIVTKPLVDQTADSVYSGLTRKQADITWINGLGAEGTDPLAADSGQLTEKLSESYSGFSIH